MVFQVVLKHDAVNEARVSFPFVLFQWIRQRNIEREILVICGQFFKFFDIKHLAQRTRTVPKAHLRGGTLAA